MAHDLLFSRVREIGGIPPKSCPILAKRSTRRARAQANSPTGRPGKLRGGFGCHGVLAVLTTPLSKEGS